MGPGKYYEIAKASHFENWRNNSLLLFIITENLTSDRVANKFMMAALMVMETLGFQILYCRRELALHKFVKRYILPLEPSLHFAYPQPVISP